MINCNIIKDLIPAYLDCSCTEESRIFVEDHLNECGKCRKFIDCLASESELISVDDSTKAEFSDFAVKIQKRRTRMAFIIVAMVAIATVLLSLTAAAGIHMKNIKNPVVYDVENGVYNLTASDIAVNEENVSDYILFTNFAQISVTVNKTENFEGTVMLYNADYPNEFIMLSDVNEKDNHVLFTGLSSAYRYYIEYEGTEDVEIIIGEGRALSFWYSLRCVISDILGL